MLYSRGIRSEEINRGKHTRASYRQQKAEMRQGEARRGGTNGQADGWLNSSGQGKKKKTEQHLVLRVLLEFQSLLKKKKFFLIYSFI